MHAPLFPQQLRQALVPGLAALALAACGGGPPEPPRDAPARRVVLITCDTLRADRLGVYGYGRPTSPAVDAFARDAVVFEEAYAASSITGPSLASLLTGLLPDEISVPDNEHLLPPEATTFAELARAAGYGTAAFVSNGVLKREPAAPDAGVLQGFELYDDDMRSRERTRGIVERVAADTADAATAWIRARRASGDDRFFLWIHFQDPHGPYTPPAEIAARFDRGEPDGPDLPLSERSVGVVDALPRYQLLPEGLAPGLYRDRYDAEIATFDRGFGRVVRALEEAGWIEGSLVVFSADHGESLGEHGAWFCHGESVHRELVRVPLVVRYPAGAARPSAARVATGVSHLDLWPTFAEALGVDAPAHGGASLLAAEIPDGRAFVQTVRGPAHARRMDAVSDGRWRLLMRRDERPTLHDITLDPGEEHNVAMDEQATFVRLYEAYDARMRARVQAPPTLVVDSAARFQTLRGLGYTDGEPGAGEAGDGHGH